MMSMKNINKVGENIGQRRLMKAMEQRTRRRLHSDRLVIVLFSLPALIPILVFWVYPIFDTLRISTTDWDYMSPTYHHIGLKNYLNLLNDPDFYTAFFNTLYFCFATAAISILLGLFMAYLINGMKQFGGFFQSAVFLPWVTPTIAVSIVWTWIFNPESGLANYFLSFLKIPPLPWIESAQWAMPAIIIVSVWQICGYNTLFFLSAMQRVPRQLYEAADLDGAGNIKKFLKITLPHISPTTFFVVITDLISCLQAYDQILILTQGGPAGSTRTVLYYYYQMAFQQFNMGQAGASAVLLIVMTALLSGINFFLSKKWVNY